MTCELALVAAWLWMRDDPTARRAAVVGALAALAVLARIDALALVALVLALQLWRGPRRPLSAGAIAFGAVVAPWWGYALVRFHSVVPASGSATHALQGGNPWSSLTTSVAGAALVNGPFAVWSAVEGALGDARTTWPYWTALGVLVVATAGLLAAAGARRDDQSVTSATLAGAALCGFAALLVAFYGWFNVPYYVSRYLGPVIMVMTLAIGCVAALAWRAVDRTWGRARPGRVQRTPGGRVTVLTAGISACVLVLAVVALDRPLFAKTLDARGARYESATGYRPQALLVRRTVPRGAVVAASQSGALGYYAGRRDRIVNLDGVVDDAAARARRQHRLGEYMMQRRVGWLADSTLTVAASMLELRRVDPAIRLGVVRRARFPRQPEFALVRVDRSTGR